MADSLADDEQKLAGYATALADAVEAVLASWVIRCVDSRAVLLTGPLREAAERAGDQALAETMPPLRSLLATDIADQRGNPLDFLRNAVRFPTAVLADAGIDPATRDEFDERVFPLDIYALTPASFADVHGSLHEPGLMWGAAKAHVHLRRRRETQPVDRTIAAFVPDLMDQSKVKGAIAGVVMIRTPAKLAEATADIVIVDLSRPGVMDSISAIEGRVIGFGSHVDDELMEQARQAGCDEVLPRSIFFKRLSAGGF